MVLSYEFTFAYDAWLPVGYLLESKNYMVTHDFATLDTEIIPRYDTLVIEQATTNMTFNPDQLEAIESFVWNGGGLFIVGRYNLWHSVYPSKTVDDYPLNQLAIRFYLKFVNGYASRPFSVYNHSLTSNVTEYSTLCAPGLLQCLDDADALVVDSYNNPIMVAKTFGDGRIVAIADEGCVSSPWSDDPLINVNLIRNVFEWLSEKKVGTGESVDYRIYPENTIPLGTAMIYYPSSLGFRLSFVTQNLPEIFSHLNNLFKVDPVTDLKILLLATAGGGYSSFGEVGVGALFDDYALISVLAHEMSTSWMGPPGEPGYKEAWNMLAGIRVASAMGYEAEANARLKQLYDAFWAVDADGTKLDLTEFPKGGNQPYFGKVVWITETLEKEYNSDLMAWFVMYKRSYTEAPNVLSTDDEVLLLSLACGVDLFPFFQRIGTTVHPHPIVLTHTYPVMIDGVKHIVSIGSNSIISNFNFSKTDKEVSFNVTGSDGTSGFCNVTIRDDLLWGDFSVFLDYAPLVRDVDYIQTYNGTHFIFYLTYTHSTHKVQIIGEYVIPEFSTWATILVTLFLVSILLVLLREMRKH